MSESTVQLNTDLFTQECRALGEASAAAKLRFDPKGPVAYQQAYESYKGPRNPQSRPARGAPRRAGGTNTAPVDGSDKPAEAGGDVKPTVKRVRKVAAPAAAADGAKGE